MRAFEFLLGVVLLNCVAICFGVRPSTKCPSRSESDARCRRGCKSDADCRNRKNNKKCICDGPCGLSCIRISQKCYEDRSLKIRLRKGTVLLNGQRYRKKTFKVGDVISYKCKRGFRLSGPSQVTCSGIGKWKPWDKGTPTCSKRCRDPGNPKDGYRLKSSFNVGETVTFICNPGYTLKGRRQAVCRKNMKWSQPRPKCEASKCETPVLPDNSHIFKGKKDSYAYGSRIILRCNRGHFLIGSTLIYCGVGGWKTPINRPLRCLPKSCGSPDYISNGIMNGALYTFGKSVTYECNPGYKLNGTQRRSCLANEKWSGSPPKCEKVDCKDPEIITNGRIHAYGTKYLDKASIQCKLGYAVRGSSSIFCKSNGRWSEKPECIGVTCDESYASIENGEVVGRLVDSSCRNSYNCKLKFTCDRGYQLNTGRRYKVAVCQRSGVWSSFKPECLRISCSMPEIPKYGNLKEGINNFLFESVIQYECKRRYYLAGQSSRECLASGRWSGNVPTCIAYCGHPGAFDNGYINGSSYKSGDRVNFTCNNGYEIVGESSSWCEQSTGRWSPRIPSCKRILCNAPPIPKYGRLKESNEVYFYKSIVKFECYDGYELIGESTRECLLDKRWSGKAPSCQAVCEDPGNPENGLRKGNDFRSGKVVEFQCFDGYTLVGADRATCEQSTREWTREVPICREKCDYKLGMEDGRISDDQISMTNSVSGHNWKPRLNHDKQWCGLYESGEVAVKIKFSSVVRIASIYFQGKHEKKATTVWLNYFDAKRRSDIFVRSKTFSLSEFKFFEVKPPIYTSYLEVVMYSQSELKVCDGFEIHGCNASSTCPIPDAPTNGEALRLLYKDGEKAAYSCFQGYKLDNSGMAQSCRADGSWAGSIPECVKDNQQLKCYKDLPTRTMTFADYIGSPNYCMNMCKGKKFRYAGIQFANSCFCSDHIKHDLEVPLSDCYFPCSRDPTRKCGGPWRISMYKAGM